MKPGLHIGQRESLQITVDDGMHASFLGRVMHPLYGTSALVEHMELAGRRLLEPHLEDHEEGVGFALDLRHTAPTVSGMTVTVTATVIEVTEKSLVCLVEASNDLGPIGSGRFVQRIVPRAALDETIRYLEAEGERGWEHIGADRDQDRMPAGLEIERKFLLTGLPERVREAPSVFVSQGWLPGEAIRERLRRTRTPEGESYHRTIKMGTGLTRIEVEEDVPRDLFRSLWPLTEGCRVRKRRYRVEADGLIWEIDEFVDMPLVLAEVELPTESAASEPPAWLAPLVEKEVTGHPEYLNLHLAMHGHPEARR